MPMRRLPSPGSVVPASPTKSSSLSSPTVQSASVDRNSGRGDARRPISAPRERTSGSTGRTV
jgi:hypothetical protein